MGKAIPLLLVIILIHIFLIFNAGVAFGARAEVAQLVLTTYLLVVAAITAIFDVKPTIERVGVIGLQFFFIGFIVTTLGLLFISPVLPSQTAGSISILVTAVSLGFMYAFVIAYDEELIFRDLLPKRLGLNDTIAQPLFGLFHAAALSGVLSIRVAQGEISQEMFLPLLLLGFIVLTALGFVWAFIRDRLSIYASTGSHFAWNLFSYGILFTLVGIGG